VWLALHCGDRRELHVLADTIIKEVVAVQSGPLIYCPAQLGQPEGVALNDVSLDMHHEIAPQFQEEFRSVLLTVIVMPKHMEAV
jgi:hypothetical protein